MGSYHGHGYRESIDEAGLEGTSEDEPAYRHARAEQQRTPLASGRKSINANGAGTGIPTPTPAGGRRQSGTVAAAAGLPAKRSSRIGLKVGGQEEQQAGAGEMRPPSGLGVSSYRRKMESGGYGR